MQTYNKLQLEQIEDRAEQARAVYLNVTERLDLARRRLQEAQANESNLRLHSRYATAADAERGGVALEAAGRAVAAAQSEVDRIRALQSEADDKARRTRALLTHADGFVARHKLKPRHGSQSEVIPTDESPRRRQHKVDVLRTRLAALRAERAEITRAPLPLEECLARLDNSIKAHAAGLNLGSLVAPGDGHLCLLPATFHHDGRDRPNDPPWAYALLGDRIRELFGHEIAEQLKATPPGLPSAERPERIKAIEAQMLATEQEEENEIRAAAVAGLVIERRLDADPRALLDVQ